MASGRMKAFVVLGIGVIAVAGAAVGRAGAEEAG